MGQTFHQNIGGSCAGRWSESASITDGMMARWYTWLVRNNGDIELRDALSAILGTLAKLLSTRTGPESVAAIADVERRLSRLCDYLEAAARRLSGDSGTLPGIAGGTLATATEESKTPKPFTGGKMVFQANCVTLCGIDICKGRRSESRRKVLNALREKKSDGSFVAYSGGELAVKAGLRAGQNGAAGLVRDLRDAISKSLKSKANLDCGLEQVILSGGPGYRFNVCISVQDGEVLKNASIGDADRSGNVRNVPNEHVPNVRNQPYQDDLDSAADSRRAWVLNQLAENCQLRAPDVVEQFKCSLKTAQRDLQTLKDKGRIKFVGTTRTGYYQLLHGKK